MQPGLDSGWHGWVGWARKSAWISVINIRFVFMRCECVWFSFLFFPIHSQWRRWRARSEPPRLVVTYQFVSNNKLYVSFLFFFASSAALYKRKCLSAISRRIAEKVLVENRRRFVTTFRFSRGYVCSCVLQRILYIFFFLVCVWNGFLFQFIGHCTNWRETKFQWCVVYPFFGSHFHRMIYIL